MLRPGTAAFVAGALECAAAMLALVPTPAAPMQPAPPVLEAYDPEAAAISRHRLPPGLEEVSGLAVDARGRLFAHGDERARVWQIDPLTGEALKAFDVGEGGLTGDFEGIAVLGERFFLVTSGGVVVEFAEGADGAVQPYHATPTRLRDLCEVEGLAAEPSSGRLLLACKTPSARALRDRVLVYELPVDELDAEPLSRVSLPMAAIEAAGLDALHPSGIELTPGGGLILVAARQRVVLELSAEGRPAAVLRLDRSRHPRAEGVAFDASGALLLADEADGDQPRLTRVPAGPRRP